MNSDNRDGRALFSGAMTVHMATVSEEESIYPMKNEQPQMFETSQKRKLNENCCKRNRRIVIAERKTDRESKS